MKLRWKRMGGIIYHVAVVGTALMLSTVVYLSFISQEQINGYFRAMFPDMIYGRAYRPFVTRALLPALTRFISSILPAEWKAAISAGDWRLAYSWESEYIVEYLVASALMWLSVVGFFFALKYLFKGFYKSPQIYLDVVCLAAVATLPVFFSYYSYIYDFPTLFFFTLGLGLMVRQKWGAFVILFLFATINKETSILLTTIFAVAFSRNEILPDVPVFRNLLLIQLGVFFAVRLGIAWIFRNNPGVFVEYHLFDHNLSLFTQPPSLNALLFASGLTVSIFYKWREKPILLRLSFGAVSVVLFVATLFFGFLDEYRDYYEAYPLAVLLIAHSLARILRLPIQPVGQPVEELQLSTAS